MQSLSYCVCKKIPLGVKVCAQYPVMGGQWTDNIEIMINYHYISFLYKNTISILY